MNVSYFIFIFRLELKLQKEKNFQIMGIAWFSMKAVMVLKVFDGYIFTFLVVVP